jgi:NADPH:quinone reductase-like Zn-dependent oxidoreductase
MSVPATAKVVRFYKSGDASVLTLESIVVAEPAAGEVRIKVNYIGLNRAEIMYRNDAYMYSAPSPSLLGYEAAGIVEAVGEGVVDFALGDKVSTIPAFSMQRYGSYGERVIMPVHAVVKCPSSFTMQQSAAIWMQYITAYGALVHHGKLIKGQTLLITAASSSVGIAAIQLGKILGARVIGVTRDSAKKPLLLEHGADHVITLDTQDLVAQVQAITGTQGVALAFDPIGGPNILKFAEVAQIGGCIIEYGALDANPTPYPLFQAISKALVIRGYTLFELTENAQLLNQAKQFLMPLFESGALVPLIDRVFTLDDIQAAHRYMESNQQIGKILVAVGG